MTMETVKMKRINGMAYIFRGFVHGKHGWEHGGTLADMVAESCTTRSKGSRKRNTVLA